MKELTITPPEGYEIDKEKSTFEKIVFKPINFKPRSWEEFCKENNRNKKYFIQADSNIRYINDLDPLSSEFDKNILPSKEYAEAFLAMMQLISLRQAWIGDWKPDWTIISQIKYVIQFKNNKLSINEWRNMSHPLSFPTQEMAEEFLNCFKDLIEQAKLLI